MGGRHLVEFRNIRDPHPLELERQGFDSKPCHTVIVLFAGLQKRQRFHQGHLGVKYIGLRLQGLAISGQFPMLPNNEPAEHLAPVADRPAIGQKPVFYDRFGVGGKLCPPIVLIGGRGFAEPDTPLLEQIAILQAADSRIHMDIVADHPMHHRQVLSNEFLLLFRQAGHLLTSRQAAACPAAGGAEACLQRRTTSSHIHSENWPIWVCRSSSPSFAWSQM